MMGEGEVAESTARCLNFEERPATPHGIRKFRKSYFAEPGVRVTHCGSIDDNIQLLGRIGDSRLGSRSSANSAHVTDMFNNGTSDSILEFVNERDESIYRTVQREPLGKPYIRGHDVPKSHEKTKEIVMDGGRAGNGAKELIYSMPSQLDAKTEGKNRELYIKSHNSYNPGEQKRRQYDWKKVDPKTHRFGVVDKTKNDEGVASCLSMDMSKDQTRLTSIAVADFRDANSDRLGRSRNRRMTAPDKTKLNKSDTPAELIKHRRKKPIQQEWTAIETIQGDYTHEEQQPDKDLGKAVRPGWRNTHDPKRTFGCPTVRNDIKPPTRKSLSDSQNYGDDTNASKLLYPSRFTHIGVDDVDFALPQFENELRNLFASIGQTFSDDDFRKLFERAALLSGYNNQASVDALRKVINEKLNAADYGTVPEWW